MSVGSLIQNTFLLYFSKPAADRNLYSAIKGKKVRSCLELGINSVLRTQRLFEVLSWEPGNMPLKYTGIDLFEAAGSQQHPSLKQAFHDIRHPGVKVQLVPGDLYSALVRTANQLPATDLVILGAGHDPDVLNRAWIYMPRMLGSHSLVYQEQLDNKGETSGFKQLAVAEIQKLAQAANRNQRRAA